LGRVGQEFGELFGEAVGGAAAKSDGDDDCAVSAADTYEPGSVGWPAAGAGRSHVDLDGDGSGGGPLTSAVIPDAAGG
jgi:hypothetical protein